MCSVLVGLCVDVNWAILCHVLCVYLRYMHTHVCVFMSVSAHAYTQVQNSNTACM